MKGNSLLNPTVFLLILHELLLGEGMPTCWMLLSNQIFELEITEWVEVRMDVAVDC